MIYIITQDGMQSIPFEESDLLYTVIGNPMVGKFNIFLQDSVNTDDNRFLGAYKTAEKTNGIIKDLTIMKANEDSSFLGPSNAVFTMPEMEEE